MLGQFENIICLNLQKRDDRRNRMKEEFKKLNLDVKFYRAIPGGVAGFCQSMFNIFHDFEGSLFVFEDDVQFIADPGIIDVAFSELPDDWDMFYLGANVREKIERYSTHLLRLKNAWCTHAIGYSAKMVNWLKENWTGKYEPPFIYDEWLRVKVQPEFKCYITDPMICTQWDNYSDIWKKDTKYKVIELSQKNYEPAC